MMDKKEFIQRLYCKSLQNQVVVPVVVVEVVEASEDHLDLVLLDLLVRVQTVDLLIHAPVVDVEVQVDVLQEDVVQEILMDH